MSRINWAVIVVVAMVSGMIGAAMRAPVSVAQPVERVVKTIRAESFELIDAQGNVRAVLSVFPAKGAGLFLYDNTGKMRATLSMLADGSTGLVFDAKSGAGKAIMGVQKDGGPTLRLYDKAGKPIWHAPK